MKKILSILMTVSIVFSVLTNVSAENNITTKSIHELTDNIFIEGKLEGDAEVDVVTVLMMKGDELKYIKEFPLKDDGSYQCKFKFIPDDGTTITDYSLKVNAGGLDVTDTVASVTDGELYEFDIEYGNAFGDPIIDFTGEVKAKINVKNKYADNGSLPLYFSTYKDNLFTNVTSDKINFDFNVNQAVTVNKNLNLDLTKSKLMLWSGLSGMLPLAEAKTIKKQTYGADKLALTKDELTASEDKITIVGIAASVTQGAHAGNDGSNHTDANISDEALAEYGWAGRTVTGYFEEKYGAENVEYYSAAIGGTNTRQALYRLKRDVLSHKPDVVLVDTPVNDSWNNPEYNPAMYAEAIIRQLLGNEHQPVIILNQFAGFKNSGKTDEEGNVIKILDEERKNTSVAEAAKLAEKYNLPFINFYGLLEDVIAGNGDEYLTVDGTDYSSMITDAHSCWAVLMFDSVHPNRIGHGVYANFAIDNLKNNVVLSEEKHTKTFEEPLTGYEYNNPHMISWKEATESGMVEWSEGWYEEEASWGAGYKSTNYTVCNGVVWDDGAYKTINAGNSVTFKFKGTAIGIYARRGAAFGAEYSIDNGEITGTFTNTGSNLYYVPWEIHGLEDGEHTITITTTGTEELLNNTNPNNHFTIAYFLVDCE